MHDDVHVLILDRYHSELILDLKHDKDKTTPHIQRWLRFVRKTCTVCNVN